ncbi:Uncharacterised protein [Mycobacteroides abscessus subsp. massiliense]|nr:Uncharacterised protein [Mycobacteroides abscessus subsp. massiliense]
MLQISLVNWLSKSSLSNSGCRRIDPFTGSMTRSTLSSVSGSRSRVSLSSRWLSVNDCKVTLPFPMRPLMTSRFFSRSSAVLFSTSLALRPVSPVPNRSAASTSAVPCTAEPN